MASPGKLAAMCNSVVPVSRVKTYLLQASTALNNWSTVSTNSADASGVILFLDQNALSYRSVSIVWPCLEARQLREELPRMPRFRQ